MEKYPSLQQIQLSEGALFWQYTLIYFIKPWPQFDHLTLHEAVLSRKWLIYFGLTRQELIREVFGFLWRNGRLGENGQIYRSVLVLPDGDPKIRPRRAGSRLEGQANNSISNTMALAMGFKFCEVFAARTLDDVDQMETMLQKTQERSCIEAKTCDVPDRVHGVPHHLHRHWTRATDSEEKLELAKPGEPLESACVFMSYVKITEASSANLLHPLYIEGVLNPKRDLHVDLVGGQRLRVVN
jgi:hypothetical protein